MPYYDHECRECGATFTEWHSIHENGDTFCPQCEGVDVRRLISNPAVSFKGTGWGGNHPGSVQHP